MFPFLSGVEINRCTMRELVFVAQVIDFFFSFFKYIYTRHWNRRSVSIHGGKEPLIEEVETFYTFRYWIGPPTNSNIITSLVKS